VIAPSKTAGPSGDRARNPEDAELLAAGDGGAVHRVSPSRPISSRRRGYDLDSDGAQEPVYGDVNGAVHAVDADRDPLASGPAARKHLELGLSHTPAGRAGGCGRRATRA
jgi:hypothetical protein